MRLRVVKRSSGIGGKIAVIKIMDISGGENWIACKNVELQQHANFAFCFLQIFDGETQKPTINLSLNFDWALT
jgi:hypothetical protein